MEYTSRLSLGNNVSLVICLMDGYLGKPIQKGTAKVVLLNSYLKPIEKFDGSFVFCNIKQEKYIVNVEADIYFSETIEILNADLEQNGNVVYCVLKPKPQYPFAQDATLIRFSVGDQIKRSLKEVRYEAIGLSKENAIARLGKDGAQKGDNEISLVGLSGRIAIGDVFSLKTKDNVICEKIRVNTTKNDNKVLVLDKPLEQDYIRGVPIHLVIEGTTDERGEGVIYFRTIRQKQIAVNVTFIIGEKEFSREVEVFENKTLNLGAVYV